MLSCVIYRLAMCGAPIELNTPKFFIEAPKCRSYIAWRILIEDKTIENYKTMLPEWLPCGEFVYFIHMCPPHVYSDIMLRAYQSHGLVLDILPQLHLGIAAVVGDWEWFKKLTNDLPISTQYEFATEIKPIIKKIAQKRINMEYTQLNSFIVKWIYNRSPDMFLKFIIDALDVNLHDTSFLLRAVRIEPENILYNVLGDIKKLSKNVTEIYWLRWLSQSGSTIEPDINWLLSIGQYESAKWALEKGYVIKKVSMPHVNYHIAELILKYRAQCYDITGFLVELRRIDPEYAKKFDSWCSIL